MKRDIKNLVSLHLCVIASTWAKNRSFIIIAKDKGVQKHSELGRTQRKKAGESKSRR